MARPKSNRLTLAKLNKAKNLRAKLKLLRGIKDGEILYSKGIVQSLGGDEKLVRRLQRRYEKRNGVNVVTSKNPNSKIYKKQVDIARLMTLQNRKTEDEPLELTVFDDDFEIDIDVNDKATKFDKEQNKDAKTPSDEMIKEVYKKLLKELKKMDSKDKSLLIYYKTDDGEEHRNSFKYKEASFERDLYKAINMIFYLYNPLFGEIPQIDTFRFVIRDSTKKEKMPIKLNMAKSFEQYLINEFIEEEDFEKAGKHCFVYEFCKASGHLYQSVYNTYIDKFGDVPADEEQVRYIEKTYRVRIHIFDINGELIRDGTNTIKSSREGGIDKNAIKGGSNVIALVWHNNHCYGFNKKGNKLTKMVKQGRADSMKHISRLIKKIDGERGRREIFNRMIYSKWYLREMIEDIKNYSYTGKPKKEYLVVHSTEFNKDLCYEFLNGLEYTFKNKKLTIYKDRTTFNFFYVEPETTYLQFMEADDLIGLSAFNSFPEWGLRQMRQTGEITRLRVNTKLNIHSMIKDFNYTWTKIVNTYGSKGAMVDFSSAYLLASQKNQIFDFEEKNAQSEIIELERPVLSKTEHVNAGLYMVRYKEKDTCEIPLMRFKEEECLIPHQLVNKMIDTEDYHIFLKWFIPLEKQTNIFKDLFKLNNELKEQIKDKPFTKSIVKRGLLSTIGMLYRKDKPEIEVTTHNLSEIAHLINNKNNHLEIISVERQDGVSILKEEHIEDNIFMQTLEFDNDLTGEQYAYTVKFKNHTKEEDRIVAPHLSAQLYANHSINMYEITKNLIAQGCKINAYHIDSIAVSYPHDDFKFSQEFLDEWNVKVERFFENAKFIKYNQTVFNKGLENEEKTKLCDEEEQVKTRINHWKSDISEHLPYFDNRYFFEKKELIKPIVKIYNLAGGSGKSYKIRELLKEDPLIFGTSTTGASALNISQECMTIDKYIGTMKTEFRTDDGEVKSKTQYLPNSKMKHLDAILSGHTLIIDEMSMLSKSKFEALNRRLQHIRKDERPFGGMNIMLFGDFKQLKPVDDKGRTLLEANIWDQVDKEEYQSKRSDPNYRYTDETYKEFCWNLRQGLKEYDYQEKLVDPEPSIEEIMEGTVYISYSNKSVRDINNKALSKLEGDFIRFPVFKRQTVKDKNGKAVKEKDGKMTYMWGDLEEGDYQKFIEKYPISHDFKVGAKIMCRVNYSDTLRNGTIVTILDKETVIHPNGEMEKIRYVSAEGYKFMPFCLAYAMTLHKTQGLTLDKVYCNTQCFTNNKHLKEEEDLNRCRYVLFSRVRKPEDIRISEVF